MVTALQPARALVDPVEATPAVIEARRFGLPLVALMVAMSASTVAWFLRVDASTTVIGEMAMKGELQRNTEQEIAEAIDTAERVGLVAGLARALLATPLILLALAALLKFVGWLFGTPLTYVKAFTAGCVATLPIALYHLVFATVVLFQHEVVESMRPLLVPSNLGVFFPAMGPRLGRVLSAVDFFNLWSAVLLGLGFAQASGMRKGRAVVLGLVLYVMYAGVFLIGIPGMAGGGPGRPGGRGM